MEAHHLANLSDGHYPLVVLGSTSLHALQPVNKLHIPHLQVIYFFLDFEFSPEFLNPSVDWMICTRASLFLLLKSQQL